MKTIKDHKGKIYYIQTRHLSSISESTVCYTEGDEDKPTTELIICGGFIYIEASLDDVVQQLGI